MVYEELEGSELGVLVQDTKKVSWSLLCARVEYIPLECLLKLAQPTYCTIPPTYQSFRILRALGFQYMHTKLRFPLLHPPELLVHHHRVRHPQA